MNKANVALSIALILLCVSGVAATATIARLYITDGLVSHTYSVEVSIADLESALADVGRHRVAYLDSGTPEALEDFRASTAKVAPALGRIRQLTGDNPTQQALCNSLEANASQRMAPSFASVEIRRQGQNDPTKQFQLTSDVAKAAIETATISQQMRQNEDRLLEQRNHLSRFLFIAALCILVVSFVSSAFMFWVHYRLLNRELRERRAAENHLRQLSGHLIRVQDDERRRFARELHDSLGQSLVAAKMTADVLFIQNPGDKRLEELVESLGDSVSQTRTMSYLLHPPLLDEVGLASAIEWLIEGYTKRTGIDVALKPLAQPERLPRHLELVLFRILQESLTNIQRHSNSAKAEVSIQGKPHEVILLIRDYGKGIPPEILTNLKVNGTHVGVGLAGMKERIRELGGKLEIKSDHTGTEITATMPLVAEAEVSIDRSCDTAVEIQDDCPRNALVINSPHAQEKKGPKGVG